MTKGSEGGGSGMRQGGIFPILYEKCIPNQQKRRQISIIYQTMWETVHAELSFF